MNNLRSTIESLASDFAASIIQALRGASIDELVALGGGSARRGRARAEGDSGVAAGASPRRRGRGGRLGRRSAEDIGRMIDAIVDAVAKSPSGLRAEQIREHLGVEAKELPRPLADAIAQGRITKSGQKRATTYFKGSAEGAGSGGGKRGGRRAGGRKKRG